MNPKVTLNLSEVGCRKPGCKHRMEVPHRHHRRCETLFIHSFKRARRTKSKWYKKLKSRYGEFRDEDTVLLCPWHHAEIHVIYDEIIVNFCAKLRKRLAGFKTGQAEQLMKALERRCREWEKEETPGVNPDTVFIPDEPRVDRVRQRKK